MGHPVLRRVAAEVPDPTAPDIRRLIDDMIETLADSGGIGLAAPQVHVSLRVVLISVPAGRIGEAARPGDDPLPLTVLVNPVIEPLDPATEEGWEGCLSIPGFSGLVPRHARIRYSGWTPEGKRIEREAAGYHARVVQHECDHLDGVLYPMRMNDLGRFGFTEEIRKSLAAMQDVTTEGEE